MTKKIKKQVKQKKQIVTRKKTGATKNKKPTLSNPKTKNHPASVATTAPQPITSSKGIPPYGGSRKISAYFSYPKHGQRISPNPRVQFFEGTIHGIPPGKTYRVKLHLITDVDYPQDDDQKVTTMTPQFYLPAVITNPGLAYVEIFDENEILVFSSKEVPYFLDEDEPAEE